MIVSKKTAGWMLVFSIFLWATQMAFALSGALSRKLNSGPDYVFHFLPYLVVLSSLWLFFRNARPLTGISRGIAIVIGGISVAWAMFIVVLVTSLFIGETSLADSLLLNIMPAMLVLILICVPVTYKYLK